MITYRMMTSIEQNSMTCQICLKSFSQVSNLNTHIVLCHSEEGSKKLKCEMCVKSYARKCDLNRHINSHLEINGDKSHGCNIFGNLFLTAGRLKSHKYIHDGAKFQCRNCSFATTRKDSIQIDLRRHSNLKP